MQHSVQHVDQQPDTESVTESVYPIERTRISQPNTVRTKRWGGRRQWGLLLLTFIALVAFALLTKKIALAQPSAQAAIQSAATDAVLLFEANLAGAHEVPAVDTPAVGRAVLSLISDTLHYRIFVADIDNVTASHIHDGVVGVSGGVVFPLFTGGGAFDPNHPISGTLTLSATQISKLLAGDYYINVHTTDVPSGEIRGQIQPYSPPTGMSAILLGSNEPSPVTTEAKGIAQFTLINTDTLQYNVAVSDIISITASHIHFGPAGQNGPVAHGLYTGTGSFDPDHPISGTVTLSAKEMVDLLTGYLYVNVHTTANPGGEIRGQIGGVHFYDANLSGAAETPPHTSNSSGRAVLALSADATTLSYRVNVNDLLGITASHIHRGAPGVPGPIVFTLFNSSGGGTFDPSHPVSGTVAITVDQIMTLLDGDFYINVHTPSYPAGALRGQIKPLTIPTHMMAALTGAAEVPAVQSDALGLARLTLNSTLGTLHYSVAVTDITGIMARTFTLRQRARMAVSYLGFTTAVAEPPLTTLIQLPVR
ncbi:MAG: CHRD domain-containing protein [Caldilineaceae bacterium]